MPARNIRTGLPSVKERVSVYQPHVIKALLDRAKQKNPSNEDEVNSGDKKFLTQEASANNYLNKNQAEREKQRQIDEEFWRAIERKRLAEIKRKDEMFQDLYKNVLDGLDYESGITGEIQALLKQAQKIHNQKRTQLYEEWDAQVYKKMQARLQKALSLRPCKEIERRLNEQQDAYIQTTNKKLAVFRDVIIEKDYDPLSINKKHTIRIRTDDIQDPCLQATTKAQREKQEMGKCHSIQQHELEGRDTLSATMWDKVESTPYGHCMDKCGNYMWKPASEAETANRKSNIYFDHYEVPRGPKIMLAECSKSRAANLATMLASNMDGGSFYDVLQQSCISGHEVKPAGRRMVPGPDAFQDRRGLYEIMQQTCKVADQRKGAAKVGDLWLDSKGKKWVPGVEDRLGRRDLFESLQRGAPSAHHITGDCWIDKLGRRSLRSTKDHDMWAILTPNISVSKALIGHE